MGKFAEAADVEDVRLCILGRHITTVFDDDDLNVFVDMATRRKWQPLTTLLPCGMKSVIYHATGTCICPFGTAGKGVAG